MVLKPSENAWLAPAAALVSVICKSPAPELARVALVLAAPKFLNQSCVPDGQVYKTPGVCAWACGRNKTPKPETSRRRRAIMIFSSPPAPRHANQTTDRPIVSPENNQSSPGKTRKIATKYILKCVRSLISVG